MTTSPSDPSSLQEEFDAAYRLESAELGGVGNRPPWSLGEPQPEIAALMNADHFHGEILDAGCGEGAAAIDLAQRGFTTVGVDLSPMAIELARREAARRELGNVTFEVADISTFTGYDNRFGTILDCTLLHSMPIELRSGYQQSVARAAAPNASYIVLAFDSATVPSGRIYPVGLDELRVIVSTHWIINEIRPARIHCEVAPDFEQRAKDFLGPSVRDEPNGRKTAPAWLLTARLK
jgi:SAM-dependent methyltransferase